MRLLVLLLPSLVACTVTPARFKKPLPTYAPTRPVRIRVVGFEYDRFRPTGEYHAGSFGGASGSGSATAGVGSQWHAQGTWGSQAHAIQGEYVNETLAPEVAAAFANTGCFQVVVGPNAETDYVFEGRADGYKSMGVLRRAISIVEAFTLTPLLGMPIWGRAEGQASINVYRVADSTLVRSFHALVPVEVATTLYTFHEDEPMATATARNFAIRDAVEQAAAAFCGRGG